MNHRKTWLKLAVVALGFAGTLSGERSSSAIEPTDNAKPFDGLSTHMNATSYACQTYDCGWVGVETISTATDIDYSVVTCGFLNLKLKSVEIDFNGPAGDLDMQVYQFDGTLVGGSYNTGSVEIVDTTALTSNSLVLKVYGYHGAQNTYSVYTHCG
jgi:hypothetical protein